MEWTRHAATWLVGVALAAGPAAAQDIFIYPQKGQSAEKQTQDRGECHVWAVNQTGYDPASASTTPPSSGEASQGGVLRGGARGAAMGAVVGAIAGDAGKGAAIGAAGGGLMGGMRRNDQRRQQQQQQANYQAQQDAQKAQYRRALAACLEGRGYTVK